MTNDVVPMPVPLEDRVAELEKQLAETQLGVMMMSTLIGSSIKDLAVALAQHAENDAAVHEELAHQMAGLDTLVETVVECADETDEDLEALRVETEDEVAALRQDLNLMANGVMAYITFTNPDFVEGLEQFAEYCRADAEFTVGVDLASGDESVVIFDDEGDDVVGLYDVEDAGDVVQIYAAEDADEFNEMMDEIQSDDTQPVTTVLRIGPEVTGWPVDAQSVPQEFIQQAVASVPDCYGAISIDFCDEPMPWDDIVDEAFKMVQEFEEAGLDVDTLNEFRFALGADNVEDFNEFLMQIVEPGFITSALGMFADVNRGPDDGAYVVTIASVEDAVEVTACLFLINAARSGHQF